MSILISGCSTGIGLGTALYLKGKGLDVICSARTHDAINMLKDKGFKAVFLDVNSSSSIAEGVKEALSLADENGIEVLVNNAGYGQAGAIEDLSREAIRAQFETNVFGLLELTNTILPHMRKQNKGKIINVSSILGLVSLPFRGAYNASKHALEALSDTLRLELSKTPIKVVLIEPGPIESKFRDTCSKRTSDALDKKNSRYEKLYEKMQQEVADNKYIPFTKPPEAVAKKIWQAIRARHPRPRYRVTLPAHLLALFKHILSSSMLDRLLIQLSKAELR